ncbi:MAG: MFS transporter, partial [Methylococcales bacterium]|nr:MFS transporter [Methylococcales bacterium]
FLWLASVASFAGDWFNLIASAELVRELSGTTTAISYLFLVRFLPPFLLSSWAGILADRFDRRKLMIVADILRALTVLSFLLIREPSQLWLLYVLSIMQSALSALFIPAKSAVVAKIVPSKDLGIANALDATTWSSMLAIGALLGGLATLQFGRDAAFVIDALTFALSGWFVWHVGEQKVMKVSAETRPSAWLDFKEGVRYLWGIPFLFSLALVKAGGALVWGAINVIEVQFAGDVFPIGNSSEGTLGIIYAVTGLGTGLGPIILRKWLGDSDRAGRWGILISFILLSTGIFVLGVSPTLSILLLGTLIRSFGSGGLWVYATTMLQRNTEDRVRGRVFAFDF